MPSTDDRTPSTLKRICLNGILFAAYLIAEFPIVLFQWPLEVWFAFALTSLPAAIYINWPMTRFGVAVLIVLYPVAFLFSYGALGFWAYWAVVLT